MQRVYQFRNTRMEPMKLKFRVSDSGKEEILMKERLSRLLDVKSIVTFALTTVMCIQAIRQNVNLPPEFVASTITAIITYYFTRKDDTK